MKYVTKIVHASLAFMLLVMSFSGSMLDFHVDSAYAADCTSPGPAAKLGVYSTDKTDFTQPDTSFDPQTILVGQESMRMAVEVQDVNGCPAHPSSTIQFRLSITPGTGTIWSMTTSGLKVDRGEVYENFIATTGFRRGFVIVGKNVAAAMLTAETTGNVQLATGTQSINVFVTAPDVTKVLVTHNPHGAPDTVSGSAGAVPTSAESPGITVQAYSSDGLTLLGSAAAGADGSFPPIPTGDDEHRQVLLRATYTGSGNTVQSNPVVVDQSYPAIVTGLTATHGTGDRPLLSWTATENDATFRVYRKLTSDMSVFSESHFLAASTTESYTDETAVLGVSYRYAVKQVVGGSYTPEFLPTIDTRIDLSGAVITPPGPSVTTGAPQVWFRISSDLYNAFQTNQNALSVQFTDVAGGTVYRPAVQVNPDFTASAASPFYDASGTQHYYLPDGSYKVQIMAIDAAMAINDGVTVSEKYTIDSTAPSAPVLSKLRYGDSTLLGQDGAVEAGVFVDVYTGVPVQSSYYGTVTASGTGSFAITPLGVPEGRIVYLVARDSAGNASTATAFDLVSKPATPVASRISMEQNAPGSNDRIVGIAGAVTPNMIVRIYATDPAVHPDLVPVYETVADAAGSFSQEVGDNTSSTFYVAVWSGAGVLSDALLLNNIVSVGVPASITAVGGDNTVNLVWSPVPGAVFYRISVFDANGALTTVATVSGSQTSLQLALKPGAAYRFSVQAVDTYGNTSTSAESSAMSKQTDATLASTTEAAAPEAVTEEPRVAESTPEQPVVTEAETAATDTPASPSTDEEKTRNWAGIIAGIGILILIIAAGAGWYLWSKPESTTVVTTVKKPDAKSETVKTDVSDKGKGGKPRW